MGGPDPDGLLFKGGEAKIDFGLKGKIVEVDRDADRRYYFSTMRTQQAAAKGESFPSSSPLQEHYAFQSNDTESKEKLAKTMEAVKKFLSGKEKGTKLLEDNSEAIKAFEDTGTVLVSEVMIKQLADTYSAIDTAIEKAIAEDGSKKEELLKKGREIKVEASKFLWKNWLEAVTKIERDVEDIKKFFDSRTNPEGKTKADVLKEIYAVMQDRAKNKLPPLDEDLVAELSEIPAVPEGTIFKHPWGTASKLYKSEAVDAFGFRYLLGVFETKDEAAKAFKKWNGEYEQKQAKGEFNKKFRKSDEFKEDIPEDKVQAFSKILGKFFEAEVEDYKKDAVDSGPDPDGLLFKGGEAKIDFGLKGKIVEVDRDADVYG